MTRIISRSYVGILLLFALMVSGCVLEGEKAIFLPEKQASALNVFADTIPDISGVYADPKSPDKLLIFTKIEGMGNSFYLTNEDKAERLLVVVVPLKKANTMLLQIVQEPSIARGSKPRWHFCLPACMRMDSESTRWFR